MGGGEKSERQTHADGDHHRHRGEQERQGQAVEYQRDRGLLLVVGGAQVAARRVAQKEQELHYQRLVQPQLHADRRQGLLGRAGRDEAGGVARDQPHHEEDDGRDPNDDHPPKTLLYWG